MLRPITLACVPDGLGVDVDADHPCRIRSEVRRAVACAAGCIKHVPVSSERPRKVVALEVKREDSSRRLIRIDSLGVGHRAAGYPAPVGVDLRRLRSSAPFRERGLPGLLGLMVVAFACGSGSVSSIKSAGLHVRWLILGMALLVAGITAFLRWTRSGSRPGVGLVRLGLWAASFVAVALLSSGWSVAPKLSFERAVSLGALFALGFLVAYATEHDSGARRRALAGLAAGALVVGALGILLLAINKPAAVQQASPVTPWRFRGFTENPNTISILAAVTLPLIGWLLLTTADRRHRILWAAGGALLLASIIAAESRGGLAAGVAGLATVSLATVRPARRLIAALVALAVVLVGGIELRVATDPGQAAFVSIQPPAPVGAKRSGPLAGHGRQRRVIRLPTRTYELPGEETEIGNPLLSRTASSVAGSGRVSEWKGVLKQVEERPLLGYGFGTEERVFVDRWYYFQGGTAENSYLGLLLQLGVLGELMVCGIGLALFVMAVRALRARTIARGEIGAEAGVLVAAACLMLIQSYIYSVGNVASGTVWVALFLLGGNVLERSARADPS